MNKRKLKKNSQIESPSFSHIKFNFSFCNKQYCILKLSDKDKIALLDRIKELSENDYMSLCNYRKETGFERMDKSEMKVEFRPSNNFFDMNRGNKLNQTDKKINQYTIFRLYKNNNPKPARIIGYENNKIFYILGVDIEHKFYK